MENRGSMTPMLVHERWMRTRTVFSGCFILVLGAFYYAFVTPIANVAVPSDYRFPFSFESNVYLAFVVAYALHFVFRLFRPAGGRYPSSMEASMSMSPRPATAKIGVALRACFLLVVGGSYLTGAMIATPDLFGFASNITGQSVVVFANYFHDIFATLIIALGLAIVLNEVARVARKEQTATEWLLSARYPEIKLLYWGIALLVLAQGVLGLFLLGTISPIGPFALLGSNTYAFETLIRHIHGPMGAVIISAFYGHVYLRIRPEYSIR